jgi:ABC-type phosphate/phosphonate transport system ATPase subunit
MLLLADEPTARLDRSTGQGIVQLLVELNEQLGVTILMVTHEHELAQRCGRIIEFVDGAIISDRRFGPASPDSSAPADDVDDVRPLRKTLTRLGYSLGAGATDRSR